ncbi:MAG: radical SAM protein [Clostridia bacterium]|nr:radical SAM protein [Clostridia bacterium]
MSFRLRSCVWEITLACCFSCRYCGSRAGKARENELTTEECLLVADQLAQMGCRRVSMIGGEVFMRPDWDVIARRLTDRGVAVAIITNGFIFKKDTIERLRGANIESVAVSVDGPERVHDKYRQEGSFRRAMDAIDALRAGGIPVSVISTLNSENAPMLEEMYGILRDKPIGAWQLQACSPMGNAAVSGIDHSIDTKAVIDFVMRHIDEAPFALGAADNIGYWTEDEERLRGRRSGGAPFTGCRAGLTSIGIDSVGNVRGCESMYDEAFNEGNLRERSLKEIWEDPEAFAYNRRFTPEMLTGACADCPKGRFCAGGCRSYNYFVHGKLYEYPACARAGRRNGGQAWAARSERT